MTLEGMFGVPLDVAATYIILFTIYGAVLEAVRRRARSSSTGRWRRWGGRARGAGPGRTVTLAGFLLGTVSGSGVATTVMLGSVSWPLLRRAGYRPEIGGAILSAAGIGALLSPPTLGAAAFLIAEFLRDLVPAGPGDGDRADAAVLPVDLPDDRGGLAAARDASRLEVAGALGLARSRGATGYHFTSLVAIAVLMVLGHVGVPRRLLGDGARLRAELPAPRDAR